MKSEQTKKRINWFYENYARVDQCDIREFVRQINTVYYSKSANIYHRRYETDIEDEYKSLIKKVEVGTDDQQAIVDIGAGTGFGYRALTNAGVRFNRYFFVEPDDAMTEIFSASLTEEEREKVIITKKILTDDSPHHSYQGRRIYVVNSALHHMIWVDEFCESLMQNIKSGDLFILCHEPNNRHSKIILSISKVLKLFTLNFWARTLRGFLVKAPNNWKSMNNELLAKNIIRKPIPPIGIRRIIDYWVGYKGDIEQLGIPDDYDEGFWAVESIDRLLGTGVERVHYSTYRHFGDPKGSWLVIGLNFLMKKIFPAGGQVFCAVWIKK